MAAPAEEQLVALPNIMADLDFRAIEECTISGGEGRGLNYQACELSNLNLYNCSIKDSKLENCKLFKCAVGTLQVYEAHNTDTYNTWARDCQFVDCLLENVKILRSSVVFSGLGLRPFQQCHIQTSTIAGVIPQDCHFLNCTIDNAKLYESTLHQCELAANIPMRKCTVSKASLIDLHKFAPQIRAMIFSYCLDWTHKDPTDKHNVIASTGKTPSLIIALRGDEKLYQEALHVFHEKNFFRISKDNEESRQAMPLSVWRTMKNVAIEDWEFDSTALQALAPEGHTIRNANNLHVIMNDNNSPRDGIKDKVSKTAWTLLNCSWLYLQSFVLEIPLQITALFNDNVIELQAEMYPEIEAAIQQLNIRLSNAAEVTEDNPSVPINHHSLKKYYIWRWPGGRIDNSWAEDR